MQWQVRDPVTGKYKKEKEGVEFVHYLTDEGWHIIPIRAADQLVRRLSSLLLRIW